MRVVHTKKAEAFFTKSWLGRVGFVVLLSIPVLIYVWPFAIANRHGNFFAADWDEFNQMYEAARLSILKYHQFPWWNAWTNGGEPLFANPQFGLFSIPMVLVLLFGTVVGLHLAVGVYFLLGFWGMYLLLRQIGCNSKILTALLSYVWTFSGFPVWHIIGGQFTFAIYLLVPWVVWALLRIERRLGWLWFGLATSLIFQSAPHYLTFEAILLCIPIFVVLAYKRYRAAKPKHWRQALVALRPYLFAVLLIMLLNAAKLFYTWQFLHEYPRLTPLDPPTSLKLFVAMLLFRSSVNPASLSNTPYGWVENGDYIGILTLVLFAYWLLRCLEKPKQITFPELAVLVGIGLCALIALGSFALFSPFTIMHVLPLFNQMRVPSRFICWVTFGIIILLAKLPRSKLVYGLLAISAIDVFAANYKVLNKPGVLYVPPAMVASQFQQYEFFESSPTNGQIGNLTLGNMHLLRATQSNYGEVYGYEPVLNVGEYYFLPGTNRCGINHGCPFVLTKNARVTRWSPQRIVLERTAAGPIKLNMNPGKVWHVNGRSPFANQRILELKQDFTITDPSQQIVVSYNPTL